jgi:hypothetical protein
MKHSDIWNRLLFAAAVSSFFGITKLANAQAATSSDTNPTVTTGNEQEPATVLSPFVVDAAEDKGSYKANSTLAGTRVRTDLRIPAPQIPKICSFIPSTRRWAA